MARELSCIIIGNSIAGCNLAATAMAMKTSSASRSREALEESGIEGLIVASARPFDLDIHAIPALGAEPAHFHYDVRYVFIAPGKRRLRA